MRVRLAESCLLGFAAATGLLRAACLPVAAPGRTMVLTLALGQSLARAGRRFESTRLVSDVTDTITHTSAVHVLTMFWRADHDVLHESLPRSHRHRSQRPHMETPKPMNCRDGAEQGAYGVLRELPRREHVLLTAAHSAARRASPAADWLPFGRCQDLGRHRGMETCCAHRCGIRGGWARRRMTSGPSHVLFHLRDHGSVGR